MSEFNQLEMLELHATILQREVLFEQVGRAAGVALAVAGAEMARALAEIGLRRVDEERASGG